MTCSDFFLLPETARQAVRRHTRNGAIVRTCDTVVALTLEGTPFAELLSCGSRVNCCFWSHNVFRSARCQPALICIHFIVPLHQLE